MILYILHDVSNFASMVGWEHDWPVSSYQRVRNLVREPATAS